MTDQRLIDAIREALVDRDPIAAQCIAQRLESKVIWRDDADNALDKLDRDMHNTSTRPCPMCDPISVTLGRPFGCTQYREERERHRD